jgi:hypothetical protein
MLVGKTAKKKRVNESIRRIYGAVLSATFLIKKNHFFLKNIFLLLEMLWLWKKYRKKLWCSFFWGQNGPEKFFEFSEKRSKKSEKCVFFEKKLMVSGPFSHKVMLAFTIIKCEKNVSKKNVKKKGFHFLKLFFKNENWTFIFVHFWN